MVEGKPLEHTYEECMRQIAAAERTCKFALGDLLVAASGHYGERYARWSEVTGFEIQSLYDIASTCRRVPIERRVSELSFRHHNLVSQLPPNDQQKWLGAAAEKEISCERLRKSIKLGRIATASDMGKVPAPSGEVESDPKDAGYDNIHPYINRTVTYLSKKERGGEYADMDVEELYRFHLDILPVINRWGRLVSLIREHNDTAVNDELERDINAMGLASFVVLN